MNPHGRAELQNKNEPDKKIVRQDKKNTEYIIITSLYLANVSKKKTHTSKQATEERASYVSSLSYTSRHLPQHTRTFQPGRCQISILKMGSENIKI